MSNNEKSTQELSQECIALQESKQTLLLSTVNSEGNPEISYAPYYRDAEGEFYLFISELAAHTKNLMLHNQASIMFITDEEQSRNQFARERLIYQCEVSEVSRTDVNYPTVLDALEQKFGSIMSMLKTLQDFHLFRLKPCSGTYVVGFGRAYEVDPKTGALEHISEQKIKNRG